MKIKSVLCDIEGTTTSISFVHDKLFPYAYENLPAFIESNMDGNLIKKELDAIKNNIETEKNIPMAKIDSALISTELQSWIKADKKETNLKSIQGKMWKIAYESGKIKSHIYDEVPAAFKIWNHNGIQLNIYSSGSIEAQKLLFTYSSKGDLTVYISNYFDTTTGNKKSADSYSKIAENLGSGAEEILFLSDIIEELDAAKQVGMQTIQVIREGAMVNSESQHRTIENFQEIGSLV